MNENYVINLGRQLGSGGKEIGEKLAKEFGIAFYDKELIKLASDESGLCKEFFEKADERASQSIIGGLFGTRFPFISDGAIPYGSCLSNDSLFKIQSDVIRELAERQSCLFVGRCALPKCVTKTESSSPTKHTSSTIATLPLRTFRSKPMSTSSMVSQPLNG